jgi:hypothetical protein
MNKEFIPYDQALALKELGFDEPCLGWYQDKTLRIDVNTNQSIKFHEHLGRFKGCFFAPLYQQAFKWFREKYDLHAYVDSMRLTTGETVYSYVIEITDGEESDDGKNWRTYEEAEIACLKKLIEIAKNE